MKNGDRDIWIVFALAVVASVWAFVHYFRLNEILMYGDAVAHINIARRVFDSRTPGLDQLGTVWLPLPHLLVLPLIMNDWMWRTGVGGSIPSMIAYVAGVIGIFRLVRDNLRWHARGRLAAWIAAIVYGGNPNILYMQATAMTESLSLALFVWAVVFFADFVRESARLGAETACEGGTPVGQESATSTLAAGRVCHRIERSLWWCALMLSGEMLTRYDGWFAACAVGLALLIFLVIRRRGIRDEGTLKLEPGNWKSIFLRFAVLIALVPVFWFTYNYRLYGNPLEFATGPYSAKAIAERTARAGDPPYPGKDHPFTAALYFVKSAALNLAGQRLEGEYGHWWRKNWPQDGWYFVLVAGTVALLTLNRRARRQPPSASRQDAKSPLATPTWPLLLFWIPLPFYALSIAYGGVPIFIPSWWPFSFYNVRYGLQLLPLAAVCAAMIVAHARWSRTVTAIVLVFTAVTYFGSWRTDPICLREAMVNSRARQQLEAKVAEALAQIPPEATILMSIGEHVGALQLAGVPLKRTVNENNYFAWRLAMTSPGTLADYAIAFDDDPVSKAVRSDPRLVAQQRFVVEGQPPATLYRKAMNREKETGSR